MKKLKKIVSTLGLIATVVFLLNNSNSVYAIDGGALTKKVLLRGLEKCYEDAYIPSGRTVDGSTSGVKVDDIMSDKGNKVEEDTIKVFSKGIGNTLTQDVPAVSCKQVFEGWGGPAGGSIDGLSKLTGKDFDISKVGFHATESVAQKWGCISFPFSYTYNSVSYSTNNNSSNGTCFMLDGDGNIMKDELGLIHSEEFLSGKSQGSLKVNTAFDPAGFIRITSNFPPMGIGVPVGIDINCTNVFSSDIISFNDVSECISNSFDNESKGLTTSLTHSSGDPVDDFAVSNAEISYLDNTISNGLGQKWEKDGSDAAIRALEYYGGLSSFGDITFSEAEKYAVLQEYVKRVMDGDDNMGLDLASCHDSVGELGSDYGVLNGGKWCKINGWENHKDEKFNVIKNEIKTDKQALMTVTFEDVLKRIKKIDESQIDPNSGLGVGVGEEGEDNCRNSAGAESLGWIVCPILSWMGNASETIYTDYVEPSLAVKPELFSAGNEGVRSAWETFRDIANVVFIILFLIVIFSQLTGVGIDNYGIKKILPKLIVAAILINLSYILCLLLVDVSNILGSGLSAIFNALSSQLGNNGVITVDAIEGSKFGTGGTSFQLSGVLAGVGLFGAAVLMIGAIWANPAILLSLLVGGLGIVVSIFFLFVLLGARKAAIIVLVVLSPLAVVCYMLPNTKKLFDKWMKLFEGLLLVYPIAGLLVGAGDYVSRLLLSTSDGFFSWITAMVVSVAPIFFIPTVLKGSFAAMGKVGGMLTGLGDSAKKKATGAARNTEAYKNAQKMGLERRTRIRAGVDRNGNLTTRGKIKAKGLDKLSKVPIVGGAARGAIKSQAALVSQARKDIGTSEAAVGVMSGALAESEISKAKKVELSDGGSGELTQEGNYYAGRFLDAAKNNDITGMNAAIEAMKNSNMKAKDISRVIRHAQKEQMFNGIDSDKRSAWYRDLSKKYGNDFLSTDYELSHFMRTGGSLNGGQLGNYGEYAKSAPISSDEIRPEDLTKMSGDSLAAMIASGKITQGMAQRVMAMNPNISEDKKIMLGAVANGAATAKFDIEGNELEGGTITSYKQFKDDVKALMGNHAAETKTIKTSSQDVEAWTGATPRDVRIVGGNTASSQTQLNVQPQRASTPVSTPTSTITSSTGGSDGGTGVGGSDGARHSVDYDFTGMSDDSVLDMATAPRVAMDNSVREAAEREYNVRAQSQSQSQPQSVNPQDVRIRREAGRMPRTESGIVLPGDTSQISKLAEQARKSNNNNNRQ